MLLKDSQIHGFNSINNNFEIYIKFIYLYERMVKSVSLITNFSFFIDPCILHSYNRNTIETMEASVHGDDYVEK